MHLTPRQKEIFSYIEWYITKNSISPSYDEIRRRFGFSSFNSVFKHIKQLEERGVISIQPNKKRAITLTEHGTPSVHVRLLGTIAAGEPIEAIENVEIISVAQEFLGRGENFCLRVKGDSMIGDGIHDGDIVIINKRATVNNNEMVAVLINNEATLKRLYDREDGFELRPSNPAMKPIIVKAGDINILGVVIGLMRRY